MVDPHSESEPEPSVQDWIEYLFLRIVGLFVALLPRPIALGFAWPLGIFAYDIVRIRRRVTLENLGSAFPEKDPAERRRIGRAAYINLALVALEMLRAPRLTREKFRSLVKIDEESEALASRLMKEGKGIIFIGGHYSTWEFLAANVAAAGYQPLIIVQDQRNPLVNRDLMITRRKLGFQLTGRGQAVRSVLKKLKGGGAVGILGDQDAGLKSSLFVDFFGRPASTYQGPAAFAVRSGAPLVAGWIHREGLSYEIGYQRLDEDALTGLSTGTDEETRTRILTEAYVRWLEERIRMDPGQYLWQHRRWKSRPELEQDQMSEQDEG